MSGWGWRTGRTWSRPRNGLAWLHVFSAIVPFVTVGLLLLMMHFIGGTMSTATGLLFDLPAADVGDEALAESVALIVPMRHETLIFFDDARYVIGSESSMRSLEEHVSEHFARSADKILLVLADRRISCGDLMEFAARVRRNGVEKVLFAEKSRQEPFE